ncbi:hypothetical protein ACJX0J_025243, partial [Zea mays]
GFGKKIPESGISRTGNAESAHLSSPSNPKSHTYISSPVLAPKPQIERFVGHFWWRSQKSYATVVKAKRAPIIAVKMQPRGAGRRGAARGYGRGSGHNHVWRRIEDGAVQNQRGGGDTLNQGNPSPWEGQANRSEEKNEDSWKGNPHPMGGDAQITIDPWTPAVNAKGCLQKGWFRISGIPMEQRSLVTIKKVGGLVGKVIEIDERTRLRNEYVRARIACRDVTAVPGVVEGSLGLFLYDFFFEREIHSEEDEQSLETGIRVDDSYQKAAKRSKYEGKMQKDKKVDYGNLDDGNIKQHDECSKKSQSFTYQMQGLDKNTSKGKSVGVEEIKTGKSYSSCSGEEKNKVHITDSEDDDDSDLLGEELMAMKNQLDLNEKEVENSEELISGTQGSSILNASQEEADGIIHHEDSQKFMPSPIPVRRVSERLKKDMGIRIEEKNRRMAVKRNLEGNSCIPESNFSCLASKEIIDISKKMG